jgi:hypothetical protein
MMAKEFNFFTGDTVALSVKGDDGKTKRFGLSAMAVKKRKTRVRKTDTSKWKDRDPNAKVTHPHIKLIIPSGYCPVKLEGLDRESIREWIIKLTQKKDDNTTYQASVYKYWVRDFCESYSEEYKEAGVIIDTLITGDINKISDIGK